MPVVYNVKFSFLTSVCVTYEVSSYHNLAVIVYYKISGNVLIMVFWAEAWVLGSLSESGVMCCMVSQHNVVL